MCFNTFVHSALKPQRQGDANPKSGVLAETMKLLVNRSYGHQMLDPNRHFVTKYLYDEKTQSTIISKTFKRPIYRTTHLYEIEIVKPEIEHREPIIVGFYILQHAKQKKLELYYTFFQTFCDADKYEEHEMDADFL